MPNENNNIITKDWMDVHDAVLTSKLKGLADAQIVLTLDAAPASWENYTTYTIGTGESAETHDFKEGDEVRIPDEVAVNGFSYYKLIKFTGTGSNKTATWVKIGDGTGDYRGTIKVTLQAIVNGAQASGDDLNELTVSVQNVTDSEAAIVKTWAGSELVFNQLTPMKKYLITVQTKNDTYVTKIGGNVGNTYTVASLGIAQEVSKTFQYFAEQYTISIDSNQTDKTDIANAKVIYNETQYANGASFKVPLGTTIAVDGGSQNVTATDLTSTGYSCALSLTNHVISALYSTEVLSITSVTSDKTGDDFAGVTFTVNNVTKTYGTDTLTWKVPYDVSDIVTADRTGFGVTVTKTPNTDIADSPSKTATIAYEEIKNGVFAYYSDGTILPYDEATTGAIGVAVIDDDACFVIDKTNVSGNRAFGGYNRNLSSTNIVLTTDIAIAKTDFDGYRNTTKLISACAGYTDSTASVTGAPAAEACRQQFSGKGYLPALGEWDVAYKYKTDITAMLSKIGGTALTENWYWSSTLYNTSTNSWRLSWGNGNVDNVVRYGYNSVRAFAALNTSLTLTLVSQDTSGVSGLSVTVTDRTGTSQALTTDSTGKVTFSNVACGQVNVSVAGKATLNGTGTFNVNRSVTTHTTTIKTPSTGVYAYYADGSMSSTGTSSAIGVAVITSNSAFVIDKTNIPRADGTAYMYYGGYNKDLTGAAMITTNSTTAKTDFSGQQNSANIAAACSGYADGYRTGSAAEDCQSRFNGKGYLGSLGEWNDAYQNKTAVNSMMTAIGGTAITEGTYWSSTLYDTSTDSWRLNWYNGGVDGSNRYNFFYVRAFAAL